MKKLCLFLPNISHAWIGCRGNIPELCKKHGFETAIYSRPTKEFKENVVIKDLLELIDKSSYETLIIISNSFWDLIARKLLRITKADAHISVCGTGATRGISLSSNLLLLLTKYFWKYCYRNKWIVKSAAKLLNRPSSHHARKEAIHYNTNSAISGLNKWIIERASYLLSHKEWEGKISTPWYILFSENDNNFKSPLSNAEHIADYYEKVAIFTLWKAGHWSFVEMPEKYDPVIDDILLQTH